MHLRHPNRIYHLQKCFLSQEPDNYALWSTPSSLQCASLCPSRDYRLAVRCQSESRHSRRRVEWLLFALSHSSSGIYGVHSRSDQRRRMLFQCIKVYRSVVWPARLPGFIENADPLERQGTNGHAMGASLFALLPVKGTGPGRA